MTTLHVESVQASRGGLRLGRWSRLYGAPPFNVDEPAFAGISGGRTSAMMAALLPESAVLTFQNTGREHPNTLDFLHELDGALGNRIVWLEFRKPRIKGDRPLNFEFAIVDYRTADRSGGPFEAFMEALAEYRHIAKDKGPSSVWARQRLCTSYMKQKVKEAYIRSLGVSTFDNFVGLRADEPKRVRDLLSKTNQRQEFRCPLSDAGITKQDVLEFWSRQRFDLQLEEHQGNCTGCFLKDESDLARVLGEPETEAHWWIALQAKYPGFGGKAKPSYEQLLSERPMRLAIEGALRNGSLIPPSPQGVGPRRYLNVVRQETKRFTEGVARVPCSCEASMLEDDDDGF